MPNITIANMPAEKCPECKQEMDFFNTFSTWGKRCMFCGWKWEKNELTGKVTVTKEKMFHSDGSKVSV